MGAIFLNYSGQQEDLVVHRQPERQAEHQYRHRRDECPDCGEVADEPLQVTSWKMNTMAPSVADRLTMLSTSAFNGSTTLPVKANSSTSMVTTIIVAASGMRATRALVVSTYSAVG